MRRSPLPIVLRGLGIGPALSDLGILYRVKDSVGRPDLAFLMTALMSPARVFVKFVLSSHRLGSLRVESLRVESLRVPGRWVPSALLGLGLVSCEHGVLHCLRVRWRNVVLQANSE